MHEGKLLAVISLIALAPTLAHPRCSGFDHEAKRRGKLRRGICRLAVTAVTGEIKGIHVH